MNDLQLLRKTLRVLWILLGFGVVAWIGLRNLPLGGMLRVQARPGDASWAVGILRPDDRVRLAPGTTPVYEVIDEPAYFSLGIPRFFRRAKVRVEFRDDGQPILELGARTSLDRWAFDLRPLDAQVLDRLGWSVREEGAYRIYERRATRRSADEILRAVGAERTAVYGIDPVRWGMPVAVASDRDIHLTGPFEGPRDFYLAIAGSQVRAAVELEAKDGAKAVVRLVKDGTAVLTREASGAGVVELVLSGAKPGLYRIEVGGGAAITRISARAARLAESGADVIGFRPEFAVVNAGTDVNRSAIDTVVAAYRPPRLLADGWKSAEASFDIAPSAIVNGEVQMILSAPGLKAGGRTLSIRNIEVEYERRPLWPTIKNIFSSI